MKILDFFLKTRTRKILTAAAIVAAIPAIALAWWLASPLFINTTVDEEFPLTVSADIPEGFTREEVEDTMATMAKTENTMTEPMMPAMSSAMVLSMGNFRDADSFHKGSGTATVYQLEDGSHVLRFEDFRVTNGPDLRVLLSKAPDISNKGQFQQYEYVELDRLKGNIGNQNYVIPTELDVTEYGSVVIYCKPFHVLFSVAAPGGFVLRGSLKSTKRSP